MTWEGFTSGDEPYATSLARFLDFQLYVDQVLYIAKRGPSPGLE